MEEGLSGKSALRQAWFVLRQISYEPDLFGAAGLNHSRQQSNENRRSVSKPRSESKGHIVLAGGDCLYRIIQIPLLSPTPGKFLVLYLIGSLSQEIRRTMEEELTESTPRFFVEGNRL
jgi:hypothetical protein